MNFTCSQNIFIWFSTQLSSGLTMKFQHTIPLSDNVVLPARVRRTDTQQPSFIFAPKPANRAWHCVFAFWLCVRLSYLRLSLWLANHSDTAPAARSTDWPKQTSKMCSKCCLKWKTLYVIKAHILQRVYFILCVENHHRCCFCPLIKCKYCVLLTTQLCSTPLSKRQPRVKPAK